MSLTLVHTLFSFVFTMYCMKNLRLQLNPNMMTMPITDQLSRRKLPEKPIRLPGLPRRPFSNIAGIPGKDRRTKVSFTRVILIEFDTCKYRVSGPDLGILVGSGFWKSSYIRILFIQRWWFYTSLCSLVKKSHFGYTGSCKLLPWLKSCVNACTNI